MEGDFFLKYHAYRAGPPNCLRPHRALIPFLVIEWTMHRYGFVERASISRSSGSSYRAFILTFNHP